MIDHTSLQLAARARALTLQVCTTGLVTLSATSTGFARTAGSFVTDGFAVGMELLAAGFGVSGNNTRFTITAVTALAITCADPVNGSPTAEAAAAGRSLTVGMPGDFAFEDIDFTPTTGRPYAEESYQPGPAINQQTLGPNGTINAYPLYLVRFYAPAGTGLHALTKPADALITLFAPRTPLTLTNGDVARVRTDVGPSRGPIREEKPGWAVVLVSIPLWLQTANSY